MFNPKLFAAIRRVVPAPLFDRLDPFEAAIREFVGALGSTTRAGERVLDRPRHAGAIQRGSLEAGPEIKVAPDAPAGFRPIAGLPGAGYIIAPTRAAAMEIAKKL